jgi:hypothetical protein
MSAVTPTFAPTIKARDVQIECCLSCCPGRTWYGRKITPPTPRTGEPRLSLREAMAIVPPVPPRKSIVATRMESSIDVLAAPPALHPVRQASHSPEYKGDIRIIIHKHGEGTPSVSVYPK